MVEHQLVDAWEYFSNTFNTFLKECVPLSVPKSKRNIYITREAKSLKNKRNRLWNKFTKTHSQSDYVAYILRHEIPYAVLLVISVETLNDKLLTMSRQILRLSGVMLEIE